MQLKSIEQKQNILKRVGWVCLKIIEGGTEFLGSQWEETMVELVLNSLLTYAANLSQIGLHKCCISLF